MELTSQKWAIHLKKKRITDTIQTICTFSAGLRIILPNCIIIPGKGEHELFNRETRTNVHRCPRRIETDVSFTVLQTRVCKMLKPHT